MKIEVASNAFDSLFQLEALMVKFY